MSKLTTGTEQPFPDSGRTAGSHGSGKTSCDLAAGPENGTPLTPLTPREHEVLGHLSDGLTTPQLAQQLGISSVTVRNHVQRMLSKLGAHSRLQAVVIARRRGML